MTRIPDAAIEWDYVEQRFETVKAALARLPHDVIVRGGDGLEHDQACSRCKASIAASKLYGLIHDLAERAK